jgi:hypothetical protein
MINKKLLLAAIGLLYGPNGPMAVKAVYDRLATVEFEGYLRGYQDSARGVVADKTSYELTLEEDTPDETKLN